MVPYVHLSRFGRSLMIRLTRLNNQPMMVNSDLIKFVENAPDTVLTLITGEKVIVLESAEVVLEKIVAFRHTIIAGPKLQLPEPLPTQAPPVPPSQSNVEDS